MPGLIFEGRPGYPRWQEGGHGMLVVAVAKLKTIKASSYNHSMMPRKSDNRPQSLEPQTSKAH